MKPKDDEKWPREISGKLAMSSPLTDNPDQPLLPVGESLPPGKAFKAVSPVSGLPGLMQQPPTPSLSHCAEG
jgi:hypothetical protein